MNPHTFIEGSYCTPAPCHEASHIAYIRYEPSRDQNANAELGWHNSERDMTEQPLKGSGYDSSALCRFQALVVQDIQHGRRKVTDRIQTSDTAMVMRVKT